MKKILATVLAAGLALLVMLAPPVQAEKESKSTTPVVAAVPMDYYRSMEAEKASRERVRAAVVKHQAQVAKAKKKAAAKKKAEAKRKRLLAERRAEQARQARIEAQKKAEARRIVRQAQTRKQIVKPVETVNKTYNGGSAKGYALSLVGAAQFSCLELLWQKESGWNPTIANASSGAYGIPQALPGSKMASAGADWATNPLTQVRWGVSYIRSTYGSPCAAWAHSQSVGWY